MLPHLGVLLHEGSGTGVGETLGWHLEDRTSPRAGWKCPGRAGAPGSERVGVSSVKVQLWEAVGLLAGALVCRQAGVQMPL